MFPSETVALFLVACIRRGFVKFWVLPHLRREWSEEVLVDFKISVSEEIASAKPRWIARDKVIIETWRMIQAKEQCKPRA